MTKEAESTEPIAIEPRLIARAVAYLAPLKVAPLWRMCDISKSIADYDQADLIEPEKKP